MISKKIKFTFFHCSYYSFIRKISSTLFYKRKITSLPSFNTFCFSYLIVLSSFFLSNLLIYQILFKLYMIQCRIFDRTINYLNSILHKAIIILNPLICLHVSSGLWESICATEKKINFVKECYNDYQLMGIVSKYM